MKTKLTLKLRHCKNVDLMYGQGNGTGYWEQPSDPEEINVEVDSLLSAREAFNQWVARNGLGGGNMHRTCGNISVIPVPRVEVRPTDFHGEAYYTVFLDGQEQTGQHNDLLPVKHRDEAWEVAQSIVDSAEWEEVIIAHISYNGRAWKSEDDAPMHMGDGIPCHEVHPVPVFRLASGTKREDVVRVIADAIEGGVEWVSSHRWADEILASENVEATVISLLPCCEWDEVVAKLLEECGEKPAPFTHMERLTQEQAEEYEDIICNYPDGFGDEVVAIHRCATTGFYVQENRRRGRNPLPFFAAIDASDDAFATLEDAVEWLKEEYAKLYPAKVPAQMALRLVASGEYATTFGEDFTIPLELQALITGGTLRDTTWHQDICPSFRVGLSTYVLWVDAAEVSQREMTEGKRFWLTNEDLDDHPTFQTDSVPDVLREIIRICSGVFQVGQD